MKIVLGMGANMGDRQSYLEHAAALLKRQRILEEMVFSPVYQSPALLREGAPAAWNQPFLNMAVAGRTQLAAAELLAAIKEVEKKVGRQQRGLWAPREIDIDILAYGEEVLILPHLAIPHAELLKRDFALAPLADVWPEWRYPAAGDNYGKNAAQLASLLTSGKLTKYQCDFKKP